MPQRRSASPLKFNEGRCCDLVIREIERRSGGVRNQLRSPEAQGDPHPVEFVVEVGADVYAIEHTGIEPFAGHIHLTAQSHTHIEPIVAALAGRLPPDDHYELQLPVGALQGLRGRALRAAQTVLADFVAAIAPSLHLAPPGRYVTPVIQHTVPGLPFSVQVHRVSRFGRQPQFSVTHVLDSSLEARREERLLEACARKFPKLAAWREKAAARTVLVLEQNDIQLTNPDLVWAAYAQAEQRFAERPDEVWLVMTVIDDLWWGVPLRIDDCNYYATAVADRWPEYDPATLNDLTVEGSRQ